jgi:hypothetical protein
MTTSVEQCLMDAPIIEYIHKGGRKPGMINAVDIIFKKNGNNESPVFFVMLNDNRDK